MTLVLAAAATFLFTVVLTIAGVGAAFVLIPVFIGLGVGVHTAMATALLLNAVAMVVASTRFLRKRLIEWRTAVPLLIVASALSPLGAWISTGLDRTVLLWLFVGFLVFAALMMLFHRPRPRAEGASRAVLMGIGVGAGGLAGFIGGLLGVGGGNIIVPALVAAGFDPKKASATTSFVVIFSSLTGFLGHASLAGMDAGLVLSTGAASALGALGGAWLMTERLQSRQVKIAIGVVLLGIAVKMILGLV
ncbi:MAG: sulfite exporter TauE/SafE family protein [Myxococcales bacterium]|nr:sulfite exporter TauE/SafE family protein [Myxococcales bacterium]